MWRETGRVSSGARVVRGGDWRIRGHRVWKDAVGRTEGAERGGA